MLQKYLITSPEFYGDSSCELAEVLRAQLKKYHPEYLLYRDKENREYAREAEVFLKVSREFETIKAFLHGDYLLAKRLGAFGVHLTSQQFDDIVKAKGLGLEVIISTHSSDEVLKAESLGADYVTFSPIFFTPNKGEPKGVKVLEELLSQTDMRVFALGGVVEESHVKLIEQSGAYGFASIRYFYG